MIQLLNDMATVANVNVPTDKAKLTSCSGKSNNKEIKKPKIPFTTLTTNPIATFPTTSSTLSSI